MRCPLTKKQNRVEFIALWLSWCSAQAAQTVTAPGGSCLPSAADRDRIHVYCPKQPQGLFPARELPAQHYERLPGDPQGASGSTIPVNKSIILQEPLSWCCSCCSSSPQHVLCSAVQTCGVSGGLGYILRIYFNWNFQTSSG